MKCPICAGDLVHIEVAPCYDCGHEQSEIVEMERGEHEYHWCSVFGQRLILCDFCDVDFGSYYPAHFGLPSAPNGSHYDLERIERIALPHREVDWFCPSCKHRLAFLVFLGAARKHNSA